MEERLISEYIGKDADKIIGKKTNWSAAILGQSIGPIWFFFRKSYLLGFIFIFITYIVGNIASYLGIQKAYYIMFFIYLFTANELYLWDVKRKINKILSLSYTSEGELILAVRKQGGTSIVAAIIYVVAFIAFLAVFMTMLFSVLSSSFM